MHLQLIDRCVGSCNTLKDLYIQVCALNKAEDLNLSVFSMITGINESKTLKNIYHVSANVRLVEANVTQIKNITIINVGVNVKIRKNTVCAKRKYVRNPSTCSWENLRYAECIIEDPVITCDKIIEETKLFQQRLPKKILMKKR